MLTIRLHRTGRKNQPFFKIVVTEKTNSSTRGRFVEELGYYNPLTKEKKLNGERATYWISKGAQPSDTVHNMLVTEKVLEENKIPKHKKSKKKETETPAAPASTPAPAAEATVAAPTASAETPTPNAKTANPQETPAPEQKEAAAQDIDKS